MFYSRWRPDQGGYDVYEAPEERRAMGDDLPVPSLPPATKLGVPSVECGREPKGSLRRVGTSPTARGSIMPISRAGLSGIGINLSFDGWLLAAAAALVGWWARGKMKKSGS